MKPSDVILCGPVPLVDTMHRIEREIAAGLIIRTLQVNGDVWRPVRLDELHTVFLADCAAGTEPWASLDSNPMYRPDFIDLAEAGYATASVTAATKELQPFSAWVFELNEKGLAAISRWVRPTREARREFARSG
jgi:hypothetical protein